MDFCLKINEITKQCCENKDSVLFYSKGQSKNILYACKIYSTKLKQYLARRTRLFKLVITEILFHHVTP